MRPKDVVHYSLPFMKYLLSATEVVANKQRCNLKFTDFSCGHRTGLLAKMATINICWKILYSFDCSSWSSTFFGFPVFPLKWHFKWQPLINKCNLKFFKNNAKLQKILRNIPAHFHKHERSNLFVLLSSNL